MKDNLNFLRLVSLPLSNNVITRRCRNSLGREADSIWFTSSCVQESRLLCFRLFCGFLFPSAVFLLLPFWAPMFRTCGWETTFVNSHSYFTPNNLRNSSLFRLDILTARKNPLILSVFSFRHRSLSRKLFTNTLLKPLLFFPGHKMFAVLWISDIFFSRNASKYDNAPLQLGRDAFPTERWKVLCLSLFSHPNKSFFLLLLRAKNIISLSRQHRK